MTRMMRHLSSRLLPLLAVPALTAIAAAPVLANEDSLSYRSSFRIGDAGVVCNAQYQVNDKRLMSVFDRAYRVVCRDAAAPVAELLVLRTDRDNDVAGVGTQLVSNYSCSAPESAALPDGTSATLRRCTDGDSGIAHVGYQVEQDNKLYLARGLAGYDSAVQLALASLIADAPVPGKVEVATTAAGDTAAFARVRAGTLDAAAARTQAYQLNQSGSFSDAEAFFGALVEREVDSPSLTAEFLANQGLQQSNLGNFAAASALFDRADRVAPRSDGVTQRLIRNYRAINLLNEGLAPEAIAALDRPVAAPDSSREYQEIGQGVIADQLAREINRENNFLKQLGGVSTGLTETERAVILDAQASMLRGKALRRMDDLAEAESAIRAAIDQFSAVRNGRVTSTAPLRVQAQHDLALILEAQGDVAQASAILEEALAFLEENYPQTPAPLFTKSWLAGFAARQGNQDRALQLYQEIIDQGESIPESRAAMKDLLPTYFELLGERVETDPSAGEKLYRAAQLLQRPGVAQTQAVLARELSGGSGEAAALFRLSLTRSRMIARTAADVAALAALENPSPAALRQLNDARDSLAELQAEQTELQSRLAEFPQYRTLQSSRLPLVALQSLLRPGEAYYKVSMVGDKAYAQLIGPDYLRTFPLEADRYRLDDLVAIIRASITVQENGRSVTYPFDLGAARELYLTLFGPIEAELNGIDHLIYEPDGPLLQLPPNLLPRDQAQVDAYYERIEDPRADAYDFRGIDWLGRDRAVSISVSQRSFADVRQIAGSRGAREYLGLGQNAKPVASRMPIAYSPDGQVAEDDCQWPLATWQDPIADKELNLARSILGQGGSTVITDDLFTDTALLARQDLTDYRIVHFATHGLVTAPRPSCPARPALVTSFGESGKSDGLLTFTEIFDLRFDADLVVLSACDTAGAATAAATREAGIETGGNYALDGLVRAFTGAGARSVLASHWPVPDDYDATERLISGIFTAPSQQGVSESLRRATLPLMDQAATSHPYYWAAFILVGDGTKALR